MDYSQTERIFLMKYNTLIFALLISFGFTACAKSPAPVQVSPTAIQATNVTSPEDQVINSKMGLLTIASARIVDEVNGDKPGPGEMILIVILSGPEGKALDQAAFSLEDFQTMIQDTSQGTIHILGDDGSETISTMAGWLGPEYKEFGIGFRIPSKVTKYQLFWPGNDPIEIIPAK
jgi:hypothetical protein